MLTLTRAAPWVVWSAVKYQISVWFPKSKWNLETFGDFSRCRNNVLKFRKHSHRPKQLNAFERGEQGRLGRRGLGPSQSLFTPTLGPTKNLARHFIKDRELSCISLVGSNGVCKHPKPRQPSATSGLMQLNIWAHWEIYSICANSLWHFKWGKYRHDT